MVRSDSSGIPLPREEMPDWLLPLRNAFLASLLSLGLKTGTVRNYAPAVDWLCAEAGRRGLTTPDGVDGSVLVLVREPLPGRLSDHGRRMWATALGRFIAWLVKENAIVAAPQPPQPPEPAQTALEALMTDYGGWLRIRCGLAPGTIGPRQGRARSFLAFRFGDSAPGDLNAISRADIVAHFGTVGETGLAGARTTATALRSLFRFLFATGRTERNLVPSSASIKMRVSVNQDESPVLGANAAAANGGRA